MVRFGCGNAQSAILSPDRREGERPVLFACPYRKSSTKILLLQTMFVRAVRYECLAWSFGSLLWHSFLPDRAACTGFGPHSGHSCVINRLLLHTDTCRSSKGQRASLLRFRLCSRTEARIFSTGSLPHPVRAIPGRQGR